MAKQVWLMSIPIDENLREAQKSVITLQKHLNNGYEIKATNVVANHIFYTLVKETRGD